MNVRDLLTSPAPTPGNRPAPGDEPGWVEEHAGDVSSALAIGGTIASFASPLLRFAAPLLSGSIVAGAVDTAHQAWNTLDGNRHGSNWGTAAYAATGVMPASNLAALKGIRTVKGLASHAADALWLGSNVGFVGLESAWKMPSMLENKADTSDWLAYGAAITGLMKHM